MHCEWNEIKPETNKNLIKVEPKKTEIIKVIFFVCRKIIKSSIKNIMKENIIIININK